MQRPTLERSPAAELIDANLASLERLAAETRQLRARENQRCDVSGVPVPECGETRKDYCARLFQHVADVMATGVRHAEQAGLLIDEPNGRTP